jgi:hypothetical protein
MAGRVPIDLTLAAGATGAVGLLVVGWFVVMAEVVTIAVVVAMFP